MGTTEGTSCSEKVFSISILRHAPLNPSLWAQEALRIRFRRSYLRTFQAQVTTSFRCPSFFLFPREARSVLWDHFTYRVSISIPRPAHAPAHMNFSGSIQVDQCGQWSLLEGRFPALFVFRFEASRERTTVRNVETIRRCYDDDQILPEQDSCVTKRLRALVAYRRDLESMWEFMFAFVAPLDNNVREGIRQNVLRIRKVHWGIKTQ